MRSERKLKLAEMGHGGFLHQEGEGPGKPVPGEKTVLDLGVAERRKTQLGMVTRGEKSVQAEPPEMELPSSFPLSWAAFPGSGHLALQVSQGTIWVRP